MPRSLHLLSLEKDDKKYKVRLLSEHEKVSVCTGCLKEIVRDPVNAHRPCDLVVGRWESPIVEKDMGS